MAIYEIFSRPVLIKYKASICSNTTCFIILTTIIKFICPFVLTYYSQGFWQKVHFYLEQPDVSFKHKMLIVLETKSPDELIFWSTYESINKAMKKDFLQVLPEIEHQEEDYNRDGKKDELRMSLEIPVSKQEIVSVKLLLIFDYKLYLYSNFQMEGAVYIHHSSSLPGAELSVIGDLALFQREPLKHTGKDERYNFPVISDSETKPPTKLENILFQYVKRNVTTVLLNSHPVWTTSRVENESFIIKVTIKYNTETILYKVGFWQLLKWALVQYMTVFIVLSCAIHIITSYVFQKQIFSTVIINPIKQKV